MKLFNRTSKSAENKIEGYNIKHFVIDIEDLEHLSKEEEAAQLLVLMEKMKKGRESAGKQDKIYLVIDSDKEYVDQVVKVMKSNNDWGK